MVRKNKEGVYYFYVRYTDNQGNLKQKYSKSKKWKTKKEALKAENDFLESVKKDIDLVFDNITLDKLYSIYFESKSHHLKKKSLYTLDHAYRRHISPKFGKQIINTITKQDIMIWQKHLLAKGFKNQYLEKIQANLRSILIFGVKYDYIEKNPFKIDFIKDKTETKKEMSYWNLQEYEKFISHVDDELYAALFATLYWGGLRIGEALALRVSDINFKTKIININKTYNSVHQIDTTPKTHNSNRNIIMTDGLCNQLKKIVDSYKNYAGIDTGYDPIIFGYNGRLAPTTIKRKQKEACEEAGVKVIRIHDFRHSHVSLLLNLGEDAFVIAKRLGHSVEMVNNVYGHWFLDSQKELVDRLNQAENKANKLRETRIN